MAKKSGSELLSLFGTFQNNNNKIEVNTLRDRPMSQAELIKGDM